MLRIWNLSVNTAALGDLADNDFRITVHCRACNHRAVLNPHYLLEKLPDTAKNLQDWSPAPLPQVWSSIG